MKKFIILGLVVLFVFLSAQGLHKVKKPARFDKWIKIGGDFIPIWDGRSNLGHPSYWFDSSFVEHGWFNYIQIDSGATFNYLDVDSLSVDKVVSNLELGLDSIGLGIGTPDSVWAFDDGTNFNISADNSIIINSPAPTHFRYNESNRMVVNAGDVTMYRNLVSNGNAYNIGWVGKWISMDHDGDDSLSGIIFGVTDTLKWDSIPEAATLTCPLTIGGDLTVSGDVKPGIIQFNAFVNIAQMTSGAKNTISTTYWLNGMGGYSFDSLVVDSVYVLANATEDSNRIDSIAIGNYCGRTVSETVVVFSGTDWGSSGFCGHTYTNLNITIPIGARFYIIFKPKAESAANKMTIWNIIFYGHPQ